MGAGGWILMSLSAVALWVLVAAVVIAGVRALGQAKQSGDTGDAPTAQAERTLADRFARGDIDTEEYERRLSILRAARS